MLSGTAALAATAGGGVWRTEDLFLPANSLATNSLLPSGLLRQVDGSQGFFPAWRPVSDKSVPCASIAAMHRTPAAALARYGGRAAVLAACGRASTEAATAGVNLAGVYVSVDDGLTWRNAGFPQHHEISDVIALNDKVGSRPLSSA
jgi:hypothetical protein